MIRDPFNIHRKNTFKATTLQATQNTKKDTAAQDGANALAMSFSRPKNVPSFSNPQRDLEDRVWGSGTSGRGYGKSGGALPMYKDKPYSQSPNRPLWRRKRAAGIAGLVVLSVLYLMGFLSSEKAADGSARKTTSRDWSWMNEPREKADWEKRRGHVVEAFEESWDAYKRYAWGYDEYHPIAKRGRNMAPEGLGWIIVDSLDTMILMNLTSRVQTAREWITKSLTWDQDQDVNTFETTIRMMGGLLGAHYLSSEFPELAPLAEDDSGAPGEDLYLEKAKDLADRLLSAFESPSGIPFASVNLGKLQGIPSHADGGASSTAEATSLQLEFKYLAKLTGEKYYWDKVEKVMQVVDDNGATDGLLPIYVYPETGEFRTENIRLGSRGDSYYEYLIKQYLQTNKQEPVYKEMWDQALKGVKKHLVTYTSPSQFTIIAERPQGIYGSLKPKMDHLVCFMPGTIALGVTGGLTEAEARKLPTWNKKSEDDMQLARELMHTCWGMYKFMATGLSAEITYFKIDTPAPPISAVHEAPMDFDPDPEADWRQDFSVNAQDVHNLQRPETVESLFYMWRITGDIRYREWGWEMFKSFTNYTAVKDGGGFTSLRNANVIPPRAKDNMESFWLSETLKYFYLLFSPDDLMPIDKVVLNTEAHPFPRFDMGKLFSTGWKRKPRDSRGRMVGKKEADKSV